MTYQTQVHELSCMESENYRKYFRILCWSGTRKRDQKPQKKIGKKDKLRRVKSSSPLAICYAPTLLGNPSQFAVYATVRRSILARWRNLYSSCSELSDDSDNDDQSVHTPIPKVPKITGIGLRTVFSLISQARFTDAHFCEQALKALLDVLQGHLPEELAQEPNEIISNLHAMLVEVSGGSGPNGRLDTPTNLTAIGSSCLIALSVARGEAELILNAVASLIMSAASLSEQSLQIPSNLTTLQRSVQSVILGLPSRNQWLNYGVPHQCLVNSFPVDLPPQIIAGSELVVRSLVSDGCFLYIFTSKGLLKIGSGYGSSIRQHVYLYKSDFFASDRHGWLGYCKNKLYVRIGRKKTEVIEIDKETLEMTNMIRLDPGLPAPVEPKSAVFSDGNQLGLILLTNFDSLTIRMYDVEAGVAEMRREVCVQLLRRRTLALGRAPFEEGRRAPEAAAAAAFAVQLHDADDDPLQAIAAGQDFALLTTLSGKVYYTGKGSSLGYKAASPQSSRWTLMKETLFNKNDSANSKKCKVIQVAVGHEGVHAILVLDNGTALFTGVARRGEDGDPNKHRRTPKPTRPKKILKAEGHYIVYAACNYGSTALVTKQGLLLMFGKDTQHCDSNGVVIGLRQEKIIQVSLGKAHAAALTNFGQVYTFGINNKGQCGREFGYTKEKACSRGQSSGKEPARLCQGSHTWLQDYCRVCVVCLECTGCASACKCNNLPNRLPGEKCGCGEGDSGCTACGVCRRCADPGEARALSPAVPTTSADTNAVCSDKEAAYSQYEGSAGGSEADREASLKMSCLPPARVAVPGGHRVVTVACGLHHTVLLTEHGEVVTFGSNQYGQLGAGDVGAHHRPVRVRVPRVSAVAAGSNHTAVLTRDGELYTFGCHQKGALGRGRARGEASEAGGAARGERAERGDAWHAAPGRVARLGPRHASRAVWVSASGDQTFVQVSQSLINTDTLFSSTITANNNTIIILPNRPEHTFKCITINKNDGSCNAWTGSEQVDFVNSLACLDPLYDVLWCYQPQMRVIKCYNILAFDSHKLHRCCNNDPESLYGTDVEFEYPNYGSMKRLEDFKNLENFEYICNNEEKPADNVALSNMSVLNQELAIPMALGYSVTRMHAALHLLGCLDSLTYAHDAKLNQTECKRESTSSPVIPVKEEFLTVNRFESHGGGWGYSGHSVEAIRFMCDTDILLGGYGLFGGRGDYTAKIKLFDIGTEGGDQEGDGELIAESDEIVYECAPRDRFPVLFDSSISIMANRWYIAWACINGPSSDCGSSGQPMVINDEIGFHFKTSKKSNNGTDVNAGQIPCLLYNTVSPDQMPPIKNAEPIEPITMLSKDISRKVTVPCFRSLITLLQWSWKTFKETILETNGLIPINYQKLTVMKHQKRLVYVIRACLRLVRSYINEIYPQNSRKRNSHEYMSYFEAIADVRNLIQGIMSEMTPTCAMLPRKPGKSKVHRVCYVQFALELTNSVLKEAHDTITACFHAFFPTPTLKWNHLCSLLFYVKEGVVPPSQIRELTSVCASMCASRSLHDVLQYIVPVTQSHLIINDNKRPDTKVVNKDVPCKSATVPRSSHAQIPPPIPPRANNRDMQKPPDSNEVKSSHTEWHLLDVIPKLLDIVMIPIKQQMMTRQCGQPHDHGEIKQHERLSEFCCKLAARVVAELSYSATNVREELDTNTIQHVITPSRFMRVNQSRAWNTGNGSPDAICFTVDRPGVVLVGVCVYGGPGNYEYSIELLHDLRQQQLRSVTDECNPANCWDGLETTHGAFSAADCQHDMVKLKFKRPVPLKEDMRYAIRLCNHGGRTANGDCGLPSVKGPDGTTFRYASCSLSFNGTTLARGQIPSLMYYSTSKSLSNASESADALATTLRAITLRVASVIIERGAELFCTLRNELTAEDLRRNSGVLQHSPAINTLIPYTLANLEDLIDFKSAVQLLEMIHKLMPHVAAMNLLVPNMEEATTTTTHYYTWVESDHPYKQATVTNMRVLFPTNVTWIVLEMDPRSITAQPEDTLTVYAVAGAPKQRCHCTNDVRVSDPPFRKRTIQLGVDGSGGGGGGEDELGEEGDVGEPDACCVHYNCTYVSVTPKLANIASDWPHKALLVPGNEVIFSLETASDYLNDYNKSNNEESRYGFRCLCAGYEEAPRAGLLALETELVYAGAACASRLLMPHLEVPPLSFGTVVEVQFLPMMGLSPSSEAESSPADSSEATLMSRGLELTSPPTVQQVLEGQPLLRSVSPERQFLCDLVAGVESTAGGRLARWLAPTPRVEPARCELRPPAGPARPSARHLLPVLVRDQYGDHVASPALNVQVSVRRLDDGGAGTSGASASTSRHHDNMPGSVPDTPYHPTVKDAMCFQAITMMKAYQAYSFEELRHASGAWGARGGGAAPHERLVVRTQPDGSYAAAWTPRVPGKYLFTCTLDDQPTGQELSVEVAESTGEYCGGGAEASGGAGCWASGAGAPARLRRFPARHSAGLRVRASPSLQAEELGRLPPGATIAFVEEVVNKDGTWVRLSAESVQAYAEGGGGVAWCLQHHRHLDRTLLVPLDSYNYDIHSECISGWSGFGGSQGDIHSSEQEEDVDILGTEWNGIEDRKPFADIGDESDGDSLSSFAFGLEPSKRSRIQRNASELPIPPLRRPHRRSNGNGDEWGSPVRLRSCENDRDVNIILEAEIEEAVGGSRLAQAGTQTSPESVVGEAGGYDAGFSPKSMTRDRFASCSRSYKRSSSPPPPLPARSATVPPPPRKHALSPAQAECLRAVFAALLWHEGIVHDAIACAAFLKFHPHLPKQGAQVVTRGASHDVTLPKPQRHSVEVSNAGQYLRIQPSALETLTRSGVEASASRARKTEIDVTIREEDPQAHRSDTGSGSTSCVVNVLPPALRALVALWDALYDSDQLAAATDKNKPETAENNENDDKPFFSGIRKRRDWKTSFPSKTPYTVPCELCGGANVPPPLGAHLRHKHAGCRAVSARGYDRAGNYCHADPPPPGTSSAPPLSAPMLICGQITQGNLLWYVFCEKCRDKALKAASAMKQTKLKGVSDVPLQRVELSSSVHHSMKENAMFLLDLAPLNNSEPMGARAWPESAGRSPPSPPAAASMWLPAPPFQCLPALGAAPRPSAPVDTARYHSLGRPPPPPVAPLGPTYGVCEVSGVSGCAGAVGPRVHRSVSMGQADASGLAHAARPPLLRDKLHDSGDTLTGAGSSLLAQPSAALLRLVGSGELTNDSSAQGASGLSAFEAPQVNVDMLINSPVLAFVLAKRDLKAWGQKMEAIVRINTVRQYAFEALNWLIRSATQPTCVHDVMWWFSNILDLFARIPPPNVPSEDNKENVNEQNRVNTNMNTQTASVSAICPGGLAARGARAAFHAFLGSVSALASSLPPASAAGLQAVRCWGLNYSHYDRAFLHSVISKILSHSEDAVYEDGIIGALHESFHNYLHKENYVWGCLDVTGWCDITVSSRQGMAGALTDGTTETFWESGDEDRNKAKWIQVSYPGGTPDDRPHLVCVHVDNTRDTVNKTLLVSFLYSGSTGQLYHMQDIEVDSKTATWVCYTLPNVSGGPLRVRCELRGPEPAVRVRQVRVLAAPAPLPAAAAAPAHVLHALSETDTLRVFRTLTSQVFGKLLEWERSGSESGAEGGPSSDDSAAADTDLREHVVGILFAGHKLTSLQRQVMSHIVAAIGFEAARARDDWETALLCAEVNDRNDDPQQSRPVTHQQDNYCFEMLSLLLALSGSAVGRAHLAQQTELLSDLLSLLHTGSERVQRQVISLLRRMITEIPPQKMLAVINYGSDLLARVTLLDHLVVYLGKAITVQVKVKGGGGSAAGSVSMGASIAPSPPTTWFMRGDTTKKHAHLVAKLLSDMAEDKVSPVWGLETRTALATYVAQMAQVSETARRADKCIAAPAMWMALAALCVCEQSHIELVNGDGREPRGRESGAERPLCTNHDDGSTTAVIECRTCGSLCAECDRFLHLSRSTRTHHRQICKEEESAIRIDIHEGCGRAKLFWLLLLVDRRTLKALAEFRGMENCVCDGSSVAEGSSIATGPPGLAGLCRFCGVRGNTGLLAIGNICADQQCQEHGRSSCARVLGCGHACGGVRGEDACLPCLFGCAPAADTAPLRQDADDMCMICFTDPLQAAPAIQLKCGHVFHLHCCKKVLINKWIGPRITFSFSQCPICKEDIFHWTLDELLTPIRLLREEVQRKALMRLEYEGLSAGPSSSATGGARSRIGPDPATYAMERYAYYVCHKCGKAYFGGLARCEAESSGRWEPAELVCGACSDVAGARVCPKHGSDFLEYKCRYCCSVAVFFCFGTSHFCNACHDDFQRVTNIPRHLLPQCPAGPKGEQLLGSADECPLHVQHPPTGEEFALGCGVCRHAQAF